MSDTPPETEHELITTALEVEQIDTYLFRSKTLWLPRRARGVFGGQVISQALVSATKVVPPQFGLHSLHCYFLLSASSSRPILYYAERLREGRTYYTASVKAVQDGHVIFVLMCSFQKPEPRQPGCQIAMPANVPTPEDLEPDEAVYARLAEKPDVSERYRRGLKDMIEERHKSPLATRRCPDTRDADGNLVAMYWMKAKGIPKYDPAFQKCILAYMSDSGFIGVATRSLGLKSYSSGPKALAMNSSLDHAMFIYNDDFDCGDWLLYVIICPRAGSGRGVVHGKMYTRTGTLVAITTQEGVVRADIDRPPKIETAKL